MDYTISLAANGNEVTTWDFPTPACGDFAECHAEPPTCGCPEQRLLRRLRNAELAYEPYDDGTGEPDWAPYVRLAECDVHGLEAVTGHRIIPTGPGDLCHVGTFACGAIVGEDVF
jgi:hypothetical protein